MNHHYCGRKVCVSAYRPSTIMQGKAFTTMFSLTHSPNIHIIFDGKNILHLIFELKIAIYIIRYEFLKELLNCSFISLLNKISKK